MRLDRRPSPEFDTQLRTVGRVKTTSFFVVRCGGVSTPKKPRFVGVQLVGVIHANQSRRGLSVHWPARIFQILALRFGFFLASSLAAEIRIESSV